MPVHWSGRPCEMDKINAIAEKHGLYVIEDACHAIKATYKNRLAGSLGNFGCFSFHPLKTLMFGEMEVLLLLILMNMQKD